MLFVPKSVDYRSAARCGGVIPAALTVLLTMSGIAGSALPVAAQNAQPPASPAPASPAPAGKSTPAPPSDSQPPPAEGKPSKRFTIGPEIGFYFLTSSKAADTFGHSFTNIGFGIGGVRHAQKKGEFFFDMNVITNRRKGSDLAIIPVGAGYRRSIAKTEDSYFNPYYGGGINLVGAETQAEKYNLPSRFRFGYSASAFAGFTLGEKSYVQLRYYAMTKIRGFDLSGTSLTFGYRF